jgi:hypothetical protein
MACQKTYARFSTADAEKDCHVGATRLMNQRVFDWLDHVLPPRGHGARTALHATRSPIPEVC